MIEAVDCRAAVSTRGGRSAGGGMVAACLAMLAGTMAGAGCTVQPLNMRSILERQSAALTRLPEEEEPWRADYDPDSYNRAFEAIESGGVLELESARQVALSANPDIHAAEARIAQARARVMEARSAFFPVVGVGHSSTRTFLIPRTRNTFNFPSFNTIPSIPSNVQDLNLNTVLQVLTLPLFNSPASGGIGQSFSQHTTNVTASWTLFEGFSRDATVLAAKYAHQAGKLALADVQRLLVQAVDGAYYQAQLYRERLRIAQENEKFSRNLLDNATIRKEAGEAILNDVLNFEVRLFSAQADVVESQGLMDNSRTVLAELMGVDAALIPADIGLAPLAQESDDDLTAPLPDEWIDRALAQRPDLAQKEYEWLSKNEELRAARGRFSPIISLSGTYGFDRLSNLNYDNGDQSSAGSIDVRWEITTGGLRKSRLRMRESERCQVAAEKRRIRVQIHSDIRQTVTNVIIAQEKVKLQRANLESARENRRIVEEQYKHGKETVVRLNDAQRAYVETDASLALSRIQLRQAWTDLRTAAAAIHAGP